MGKHYDTFLTMPPRGSRYEYFVASFTILNSEKHALPWDGESRLPPPALEKRELRARQRFDKTASIYAENRKQFAAKVLESLGVSKDRHKDAHVCEVIDLIELGIRFSLQQAYGSDAGSSQQVSTKQDGDHYPKAICWDVVTAANLVMGRPGPTALAKYFNELTHNSERGHGLEPDHIRRALNSHARWMARNAPCSIAAFDNWACFARALYDGLARQFRALLLIADQAADIADLKSLRGAALAEAIHKQYDLFERMDRAEQILWPVHSAA
ncbi:hypothetical protein [Rhizobium leguminosarum]|uniref:hypothetical protein n=1 Tax=Rhizobium leguminosarum TaxID=384 RepID=UPI0024B3270D|nr:hypothetical protein [Rhizobium leguminosarum]WHO77467.1 hypothetical protein QMO81_000095 [Rhizobium leguminosarum]